MCVWGGGGGGQMIKGLCLTHPIVVITHRNATWPSDELFSDPIFPSCAHLLSPSRLVNQFPVPYSNLSCMCTALLTLHLQLS